MRANYSHNFEEVYICDVFFLYCYSYSFPCVTSSVVGKVLDFSCSVIECHYFT